ncbi:TOBE domain-containing protein [Roseitalea porphyridii]|uniref:TOBE domain-containing protein n=1 Tax=Roseitalea porphyridii TaxID=1852022 RepID=A0A4P6V5Y2_9HYPH|nr:TOBE domain-containing protein [Roseitalea porphyridii]QBK31986.1 TOBE domain-containing protein [Roseitalea porphyridii]
MADFVGTNPMNFIDARVQKGGKVVSGKTTWPISLPDQEASTVRLGIRPEDFRVQSGDARNVDVTFVEPLGSDTLVHGRVGEQEVPLRIDPQAPVRIGDRLPVAVNAAKLQAFDPDTGLRVN